MLLFNTVVCHHENGMTANTTVKSSKPLFNPTHSLALCVELRNTSMM